MAMTSGNGNNGSTQYDTAYDGNKRRQTNDPAVRITLLEHSMESIKQQLQGINANMSKLVWLVFTALIIAVLKLSIIG